jgi:hypothetical protein
METDTARHCRNCAAVLTDDYCAQCGQRDRDRELRMVDLAGEAFEDLSHLDGRLWRTLLGLTFRPGKVTADYLGGHRARYLPPLRLYLVISFVVFLLMSLSPVQATFSTDPNIDLSEIREEQGRGIYVPVERESGETEVLTLQQFFNEQREDAEGVPDWLAPWLERLANNAANIEADPDEFVGELIQRLPQMMFLLLPLFALILQLAYAFSGFHYLQHFIFSLHYHTTAFIYFILLYPGKLLLPGDFGGVVLLALFIYLPVALVRVYGSSVGGAIFKGLAVGISYYMLTLAAGAIFVLVNLALL